MAVAGAMAAIEIVEDRYRDYAALAAPTLVADDFFGAGCVLGEERSDGRALDLSQVSARMLIDGREVGRGRGSDILGDPLSALLWLANDGARRGRALAAGTDRAARQPRADQLDRGGAGRDGQERRVRTGAGALSVTARSA